MKTDLIVTSTPGDTKTAGVIPLKDQKVPFGFLRWRFNIIPFAIMAGSTVLCFICIILVLISLVSLVALDNCKCNRIRGLKLESHLGETSAYCKYYNKTTNEEVKNEIYNDKYEVPLDTKCKNKILMIYMPILGISLCIIIFCTLYFGISWVLIWVDKWISPCCYDSAERGCAPEANFFTLDEDCFITLLPLCTQPVSFMPHIYALIITMLIPAIIILIILSITALTPAVILGGIILFVIIAFQWKSCLLYMRPQ